MAVRKEDLRDNRDAVVLRFPAVRSAPAVPGSVYRRRRVAVAVAAIMVPAALLASVAPQRSAQAGGQTGRGRSVVVRPGDTLWGIAERHAPRGADVRGFVDSIEDLNDLEGPLQAGSRIRIPR